MTNNPHAIKDNTSDAYKLNEEINSPEFADNIILFPGEAQKETLEIDNLAGFLFKDDQEIYIGSRFSENSTLSGDFFFNYMLSKAVDEFALLDPGVSAGSSQMYELSVYVAIFVYWLKKALQKGLLKEYIRNSYNDSNVRGTIDVPRHIKQNIPFLGKIAYTQREHSTDNATTELIRHTIEFLSTQPIAGPWLDQVNDEIRQIKEVTPSYRRGNLRRVIERNRNYPVRHSYYQEYRDLQKICLQILQYESFVYGGGDDRTFGVLFDCAILWENYLAGLLKKVATSLECIFYHPDNLSRAGKQQLFKGKESPVFPDFIVCKEGRYTIADAKYKFFDKDVNSKRRRRDVYQVLSYMLRFDADTGILIYPNKWRQREITYELLKGIDGSGEPGSSPRESGKRLVKLAMRIPEQQANMKFDEFVKEMERSEGDFRELLKKFLPTAS